MGGQGVMTVRIGARWGLQGGVRWKREADRDQDVGPDGEVRVYTVKTVPSRHTTCVGGNKTQETHNQ